MEILVIVVVVIMMLAGLVGCLIPVSIMKIGRAHV